MTCTDARHLEKILLKVTVTVNETVHFKLLLKKKKKLYYLYLTITVQICKIFYIKTKTH